MVYLKQFNFLTENQELAFFREMKQTCYNTFYPFQILPVHQMEVLEFEPVTILYGGNGSGKTTVLNIIAEKLRLQRDTLYNRSSFFEAYTRGCDYELLQPVPEHSAIITSDDVFDYLLNIRCLNENLDNQREKLLVEYRDVKYSKFQMRSLEDYDELKKHVDATRSSGSQYAKSRLMEAVPEQSNGESALHYFTEAIKENALYLLDEPENSLSAQRQLELRQFLSDSVRFFGCQFVISTHSPFLLSLPVAKIYDLDVTPPQARKWTDLENVRIYREFFKDHDKEF